MFIKVYDLSLVQFGSCDLKSGVGRNPSCLPVCEIPYYQTAMSPITVDQASQRRTRSLLLLKKQILLVWNTCHHHMNTHFSCRPVTGLFTVLSCFPTSAFSHKVVDLNVLMYHVSLKMCPSATRENIYIYVYTYIFPSGASVGCIRFGLIHRVIM